MGQGSYREMEGRAAGVRRFVYDHAKYMVVDDASVLIGSENYSPTGQPQPGQVGNRGWEVFVHDPSLAANMMTVFNGDRATTNRDIHTYVGLRPMNHYFIQSPDGDSYTGEERIFAPTRMVPLDVLPATQVMPVFSPDTSLNTLTQLIRSAKRTLDIQQLNFDSNWDKQPNKSPLLAEVVAAARRGVQVRVLLNDDASFGGDPTPTAGNAATVAVLKQYATAYRLNLSAKIANLKGMGVDYIHNKGVLVDGAYTLVASINWGQNSVENNREAGVILASPQINQHYQALFNSDWSK
jgi:phosphatidylserine/phosphatidylglycerophosphate/cardiolipin synthase-like enzyme